MTFHVSITSEATGEIRATYEFLCEHGPGHADRWLLHLHKSIATLREMPRRCPLAPEYRYFPAAELRHLLVGRHRVIYEIIGREVRVLHVRHSAQAPL